MRLRCVALMQRMPAALAPAAWGVWARRLGCHAEDKTNQCLCCWPASPVPLLLALHSEGLRAREWLEVMH